MERWPHSAVSFIYLTRHPCELAQGWIHTGNRQTGKANHPGADTIISFQCIFCVNKHHIDTPVLIDSYNAAHADDIHDRSYICPLSVTGMR